MSIGSCVVRNKIKQSTKDLILFFVGVEKKLKEAGLVTGSTRIDLTRQDTYDKGFTPEFVFWCSPRELLDPALTKIISSFGLVVKSAVSEDPNQQSTSIRMTLQFKY